MPLVIDTYNVLHVTGVLPPEMVVGEPEGLAQLIAASRFAAEAVWLVCDGVPRGATRVGRIVIEGAGARRNADDHIVEIVRASSAPRSVTVVTSDRELGRRVRSRGATVVRSEEFLAGLVADAVRAGRKPGRKAKTPANPRRSVPLSEREVLGWMEVFRISAEQAAIEAAPSPAPAERSRRVHSTSTDAALERYLEATKDLADPLSVLDRSEGAELLERLGSLDDSSIDALMRAHEPRVVKDGRPVGGRERGRKRAPRRRSDA